MVDRHRQRLDAGQNREGANATRRADRPHRSPLHEQAEGQCRFDALTQPQAECHILVRIELDHLAERRPQHLFGTTHATGSIDDLGAMDRQNRMLVATQERRVAGQHRRRPPALAINAERAAL